MEVSFLKNDEAKHFEDYFLLINGEKQTVKYRHLGDTADRTRQLTVSKDEMKAALEVLSKDGDMYPFKIQKFNYNGFYGETKKGFLKETARFLEWTGDPGIAVMELSNGQKMNVPTFAIPGYCLIPMDETYNRGVLFGSSSKA